MTRSLRWLRFLSLNAGSLAVPRGRPFSTESAVQDEAILQTITSRPANTAAEILKDSMDRSPRRRCIATKQHLPSDYLVRFVPSPESEPPHTPSPTSDSPRLVLTPRTARPRRPEPATGIRSRKGLWVSCRRDAVDALTRPGPHLGILRLVRVPPNIADQVEVQLQERVIFELERLRRLGRARPSIPGRKGSGLGVGGVLRPVSEVELEGIFGGHEKGGEGGADGRMDLAILDPGPPRPHPHLLFTPDRISSSPIPIFSLPRLLPTNMLGKLDTLMRSLLVSPDPDLPAAQAKDNTLPAAAPYSTLVVQAWPALGLTGMAGVPLVKALLRLRLWSGEGWVESPSALGRRE